MGTVTEGAARVHQGDTVSIGSMVACLNKSGSVKVLSIAPVHPVGLKVTGWTIRPNNGGQIGTARASLSELGIPHIRTVGPRAKCVDNTGQGEEFIVQVVKTTTGEAGAHAWKAIYVSDGQTKTFTWTLTVKLCNENWADSKACTALKV
jgi:hypothetical protein